MSKLSKGWNNSGIANFVNNWKRPLIGLAGGALGGAQYPLEVPLRMKTYTGLTGGSILFVV